MVTPRALASLATVMILGFPNHSASWIVLLGTLDASARPCCENPFSLRTFARANMSLPPVLDVSDDDAQGHYDQCNIFDDR